jgi:hypothetical protein
MNNRYFKQTLCLILGVILLSLGSFIGAKPAQADYFKCFQSDPSMPKCSSERLLVNSCPESPLPNKVRCHPKSVAIHGYVEARNNPPGVICVGGKNEDQIITFINDVKANRSAFKDYNLEPINAPKEPINASKREKELCEGLEGIKPLNIVNRNSEHDKGGLQLELSPTMRHDLAQGKGRRYDTLRDIIYGAIEKAMKV